MDSCYTLKKDNPRRNANIFSKMFFIWMIKLFYKGTSKGLELSDLYKNLPSDSSQKLTDALEKNWEVEVAKAKEKGAHPSLLKALSKTFFWGYMKYGITLLIVFGILRAVQPVILSYFIRLFFGDPSDKVVEMYVSGSIIILMSFVVAFANHHTNYGLMSTGMKLRIATSSLIYRKSLKLNQKSLGQTAAGQVVNLLSNDVSRFDLVTNPLHFLWITPFQVVLITYFMWWEVGISSLAGVLSMVLFTLPVQGYLGKLTSVYRLEVAHRTDNRVKIMSEIISGIQVIKMYTWEKPFEKIVQFARKAEVEYLTRASYLRGVYLSCMVFIERASLCVTICCFVLLGNVVTADKVFSLAQFFNVLQLGMAILYPMAISIGAETLVSIRRLQEFLILEEKEEYIAGTSENNDIVIENVEARWTPTTTTLDNFSLTIPAGALCAVVGPVGAGKSSLLQLLLGELPPSSGSIKLSGDLSYACQEPWLFVSSVRNNILFGQQYDRSHYREVVKVCALEKDFNQLPQRDRTLVGERGVSLSGGQRARINLARAVYREADVYLLDDPLSAVDTHVGKHLFDKCIIRYLRGKTRILVTHQLQFLKKADIIVVLNAGKIEACGTFEQLSESKLDFSKLLVSADETNDIEKKRMSEQFEFEARTSIASRMSNFSVTLDEDEETVSNNDERMDVNATPFKDYFKSVGSCCLLFSLFFVLLLGQTACSSADYWVTFWTSQEALRYTNMSSNEVFNSTPEIRLIKEIERFDLNEPDSYYSYVPQNNKIIIPRLMAPTPHNVILGVSEFTDSVTIEGTTYTLLKSNVAMYIYAGIIVTAIIVTTVRSFLFFKVAMTASKNLHGKMFSCMLETPMRFFDTNPSGRILNRFSKDMGSIDEILPRVLLESIQIILVMCGILVMVSIANAYMIIFMVLLGALFFKLREWFIATAKDIKNLEGIAKSPVFSHLNSTLYGITTIRASKAEAILRKQFDEHQDVHTSAWYLTIMCSVSFGLWLDLICVIFVACVTYSFIILTHFNQVNASVVGLAISQSMVLTGMLQYGMRQTAEVVNQLTSVERVMQYTKLDKEHPLTTPQGNLPALPWPTLGKIEFVNLFLRYSPNDAPVLNNLNLLINHGEKIGIVGRTGAGKSSLIAALFRLAPTEGSIILDSVDTKILGLKDLRKKISIIPQEPVLFSATVRYNLDPFNEFSDDKLWSALAEVELKDAVSSLDFMVTEAGSNFSLGQRQLICLARAVLRNNKILVMDEATANVDLATDALIQSTIRRKFADCTVLTIAHRLNTIMDSDKVLVMDTGCMVEFDHPYLLLENSEGYFYSMLLETGPSMTKALKEIAQADYHKKFGSFVDDLLL